MYCFKAIVLTIYICTVNDIVLFADLICTAKTIVLVVDLIFNDFRPLYLFLTFVLLRRGNWTGSRSCNANSRWNATAAP